MYAVLAVAAVGLVTAYLGLAWLADEYLAPACCLRTYRSTAPTVVDCRRRRYGARGRRSRGGAGARVGLGRSR